MAEEYFSKAEQKEAGDRIRYYESLRHLGVESKNVAERTYGGRDHIWVQDRIDGKWLFWASKPQQYWPVDEYFKMDEDRRLLNETVGLLTLPTANGTVVDGKVITDSEILAGDTVEFKQGHDFAGHRGKVYSVSRNLVNVSVPEVGCCVTVEKVGITKVTDEK